MKKAHNTVVLLSGGIDSSACVNYYLSQKLKPKGLFIDYALYNGTNQRSGIVVVTYRPISDSRALAAPLRSDNDTISGHIRSRGQSTTWNRNISSGCG